MENEAVPQPIDTLMTKLGLSNADLVKASTEQLSFKMVQKARKGRRLSLNIQEKILTALLALRPELKVRRRELFHYELDPTMVGQIKNALTQIREKKIKYPQFIDALAQTGINYYAVDVAVNRVTFYGAGGDVHIEQGPGIGQDKLGRFDDEGLRLAITDAQNEQIDHPTFLKRIYNAGIEAYEVNIRNREIRYKGVERSYKESIPLYSPPAAETTPSAIPLDTEAVRKVSKLKKTKKVVRPKKKTVLRIIRSKSGKRKKTWKAVKKHRVKKR